jgi:hypothetical protein
LPRDGTAAGRNRWRGWLNLGSPFRYLNVPFQTIVIEILPGGSMLDRAKVLFMITTFALSAPVAAQAPSPMATAFDGKYVGVSADVSKTGRERSERCPREHVPDALTITMAPCIPHEGTGGREPSAR